MFTFIFFLYLFIAASTDNHLNLEFYEKLVSTEDFYVKLIDSQTKHPTKYSKCKAFSETQMSGFVVMLLFKSSGRLLGFGGIIDRKTVLTTEQTLTLGAGTVDRVLILAGYFSPWWGKDAQVREAYDRITNEYELSLVEVRPPWRFNERIYPIELKDTATVPEDGFLSDFLVYGIPTNAEFSPGDRVAMKLSYAAVKHSPSKENDCGKDYPDLKPSFNESIHQCLYPNATFCTGCIGSPVVVVRKKLLVKDLAGIVVRSSCLFENRPVIMVKISAFASWIQYNNFIT